VVSVIIGVSEDIVAFFTVELYFTESSCVSGLLYISETTGHRRGLNNYFKDSGKNGSKMNMAIE
jgi:hypothetical protein